MIEEFLRVVIVFAIILGILWLVNAAGKKFAHDNRQWREAAQQYGLQYENMRQGIYLANQLSLDLQDFSNFLPVVQDPAHVLGIEHKISGLLKGRPVVLIDARAGFRQRFSIKPGRTSPFFFFVYLRLSSACPTILLSSRKLPWGEVHLQPPSGIEKLLVTDTFTVFAQSENQIAQEILHVTEKYGSEPAFDIAIMNDKLYIFSPFRPDPRQWLRLSTDISDVIGEVAYV